jgi:hypothetical protein
VTRPGLDGRVDRRPVGYATFESQLRAPSARIGVRVKRTTTTATQRHPRRLARLAEPALLPHVPGVQRPEIVSNRDAVLVTRPLQTHHDRARRPVEIA